MREQSELRGAIIAADHALSCLEHIQQYLAKTVNWEFLNLFGNQLADYVSECRAQDAYREFVCTRSAVWRFGKELEKLETAVQDEIRQEDYSRFLQGFFQCFEQNWMTQFSLEETKRQVAQAKIRIQNIRLQLNQM